MPLHPPLSTSVAVVAAVHSWRAAAAAGIPTAAWALITTLALQVLHRLQPWQKEERPIFSFHNVRISGGNFGASSLGRQTLIFTRHSTRLGTRGWVTDLWNSRGHAEEDKANGSWEKLHFGSEIGSLSRCVDLKCVLLCIEAKSW